MIAQQRQQEALANNIANANTPGYKADQAALRAFPELLIQQMSTKKIPAGKNLRLPVQQQIGALNTGAYVQEMIPDYQQGDVRETDIATDLALVHDKLPDETGSLFFTVQLENGETRYTRNGNFTIDGEGYLVTNEGYYVLDVNGGRIQTGGADFIAGNNGEMELAGGATQLGLAYAPDANALVKEGNGLFSGETEAVPADAVFSVAQGMLERSNVDSLQAMTQMMESYRMFETNQRVLKAYDESMGKAVNEIGRLG
jgi:flagellar basal-body rod protein FlgG